MAVARRGASAGWTSLTLHPLYRRTIEALTASEARRLACLSAVPLAWILVMNVGPMLQMVRISFLEAYPPAPGQDAGLTLAHWTLFFREQLYLVPFARTFVFATALTAITLLLTYPVAYYLARRVPAGRQLRLLLLLVPFWVGEVVRTFAIMILLGNRGFLNAGLMLLGLTERPIPFMYTSFSLGMGVVYLTALYMLLPLYAALEKIPASLYEAASDLGAGGWTRFRRITLPLSKDGIASGCILVFLISTGYYATPVLLGGPNTTLFAETIGGFFHAASDRWPVGAAFSTIMLIAALGTVGAFMALMRAGGRGRGA